MSGGLLRGWLAALVLALLALPFAGPVDHPALLVLALVLTGLIFAALGVITGIWADTFDQHAFIAGIVTQGRSATDHCGRARPARRWATARTANRRAGAAPPTSQSSWPTAGVRGCSTR